VCVGFVGGYLAYDCLHCTMHARGAAGGRWRLLSRSRRAHMAHHYRCSFSTDLCSCLSFVIIMPALAVPRTVPTLAPFVESRATALPLSGLPNASARAGWRHYPRRICTVLASLHGVHRATRDGSSLRLRTRAPSLKFVAAVQEPARRLRHHQRPV